MLYKLQKVHNYLVPGQSMIAGSCSKASAACTTKKATVVSTKGAGSYHNASVSLALCIIEHAIKAV